MSLQQEDLTQLLSTHPLHRARPVRRARQYEFELVRTEERLRSLRSEWTRLYLQSRPRNPFVSHEWASACWRHLCPDAGLFIVTARAQGRLVGVAPLRIERRAGFRVLRFLGKSLSPYVGFLRAPDFPDVDGGLLEGLGQNHEHWDLLLLNQLASPFTDLHLIAPPASLRGHVSDSAWKGSSYLALDADWETLCAEGPRWLRSSPKRVRKFERSGGTIERYLGQSAAEHVEEIDYVEERSWKVRYGQSASPEIRRRVTGLLREAFTTLGARGEIELWLARIEGDLAAYEINLLMPDRVWLYRGAYNEAHGKLTPGAILDFVTIEAAWQEGRREYDYMSGDEAYKVERTNGVRPLKELVLHPRTPRGYLAYTLLIAPRRVVECCAPLRAALRLGLLLRKCPRALLPGSGIKRFRIH